MDENIQDVILVLLDMAGENGSCLVSLVELTKRTGMFIDEIIEVLNHLLEKDFITCHDIHSYQWSNQGDIHRSWSLQLNFFLTSSS